MVGAAGEPNIDCEVHSVNTIMIDYELDCEPDCDLNCELEGEPDCEHGRSIWKTGRSSDAFRRILIEIAADCSFYLFFIRMPSTGLL